MKGEITKIIRTDRQENDSLGLLVVVENEAGQEHFIRFRKGWKVDFKSDKKEPIRVDSIQKIHEKPIYP